MQANVTALVTWVTREVLNTSEPLALLALGVVFFALSFGGRTRRVTVSSAPKSAPAPARRAASQSTLSPQESH
ncbi:MAG TPA: hypothetical protein VL263_15490 [Vicinamibacterales bacterium]|jgi:hypothetical protein|nr:hypothetical protein [Vicinamibacterales bacterium]